MKLVEKQFLWPRSKNCCTKQFGEITNTAADVNFYEILVIFSNILRLRWHPGLTQRLLLTTTLTFVVTIKTTKILCGGTTKCISVAHHICNISWSYVVLKPYKNPAECCLAMYMYTIYHRCYRIEIDETS